MKINIDKAIIEDMLRSVGRKAISKGCDEIGYSYQHWRKMCVSGTIKDKFILTVLSKYFFGLKKSSIKFNEALIAPEGCEDNLKAHISFKDTKVCVLPISDHLDKIAKVYGLYGATHVIEYAPQALPILKDISKYYEEKFTDLNPKTQRLLNNYSLEELVEGIKLKGWSIGHLTSLE